MSRGFVCSLAGVALTILAWYGPWAWPAWPAFTVLHIVFGSGGGYHDLDPAGRGAVIVALIIVNVAFWGAVVFVLWVAAQRAGRDRLRVTNRTGAGMDSS
ncbi:MAG TPA: hypothetical protein VNA04_15685 [Thermoanaerobaculia bacterium]|nr:hypothetical protein [Thermoanaerobaculia bacterium]